MASWFPNAAWRAAFILLAVLALAGPSAAQGGRMGGGGGSGMGGGGMGGGGMGGGGMGGGVIDPAPGGALVEPADLATTSPAPGVVRGKLEVRLAPVSIGGTTVQMHTYNGMFPGPTIRVKKGDRLELELVNSLPGTTAKNILGFTRNHTNLHTHGLHVSPEEPADAAHLDIPPGGSYAHVYDLASMYPGTLNFYHPHVHGLVAEQYWAGLVGALVVDDAPGVMPQVETHLLVLKDIAVSGGEPEPYTSTMQYMHGKEGPLVTVNGQVNPVLAMQAGQVQRWRVLNASNARFYKLQLQNHPLHVAAVDGGPLDKPYPMATVLLSPGERVDLLVKAGKTKGTFKLLSLPYTRRGNMASEQITLMTVKIQGSNANGTLPSVLAATARRMTIDTSALPHRKLVLSMAMGRGYINGQDFDVDPFMIMSTLGEWEVWEVVNQSGMDHPFHQHTDAAQVLAVTGGDAAYAQLMTSAPAWKDTVLVPKMGSVTLLVPVMDWKGMAMFHCHIVEHEDIGMMGMWHRMPMAEPMP